MTRRRGFCKKKKMRAERSSDIYARELRSAWFAPQKLRAELPSNVCAQRSRPRSCSGSMRSSDYFRSLAGMRTMVSGRSSVSSRSLFWCFSLLALTVRAFRRGMGTLRPGVPLPWPGWWTPVGVSNHGKTHRTYSDHVRPFELCGPCQGFVSCFLWDRPTLRRADHRVLVAFCSPVPFTAWLPVLPFGFSACAFVGNTVVGNVNQRVGRSPVVWCMCALQDSARGGSGRDHFSSSVSHVLMRHGVSVHRVG